MLKVIFSFNPQIIFLGSREDTEESIRSIIANACSSEKATFRPDNIEWISHELDPEEASPDIRVEITAITASDRVLFEGAFCDCRFRQRLEQEISDEIGFFNVNPDEQFVFYGDADTAGQN